MRKHASMFGSLGRRPVFELLEERAMLSAAQDIQNQIAPYQNALNTALDVAASLPLVGRQFKDLQELDTALTNALSSIEAQTQNLTSGHFQLAIPLPSISHTFTFDLGLDNFLQFSTSGGVAAALNPVLNVGFDYQNGTATINTAQTNLDLGFSLALPSFQASLSFNHILYAHAVDQGTNFNGHLKFVFGAGNTLSPQFSGDAHIRLGLSLNFVDPALNASFNPSFSTNLELDWALDPQSNQVMTPHIVLRNFGMDASSFLHGFMGDIVKTVQKFTKPLQPFIDVFDTPVPILSAFDSSQTVGDLLLDGAGFSADQHDRFELMIKIIKAVNVLDLSATTGGGVITFGDINLTGDARQLGGFNFDTSQIQGVVDDIFNSPFFEDVQDTLETVANYAGFTSTAGFQFPLFEDPGPVLGGILTGQARTMFSFSTGREHFELAPSIGVGIKDLLGIFLTAGITFDANLSMGYDTAGLIKFVQDPLKRPEDLLHGFYFDNSIDTSGPPVPNVPNPKKTALYLQGFAELSASAVVTISGGLYANLNVELASSDNSSHVYLDTIIQNIGNNAKAFNFAGQLYAAAQIELTFPTVVGPDITLFSYELARETLVNFDPPPPPTFSKPLVVVDVTNDHTLELDVNKMTPGSVVTVQPVHDLPVSGGFVADGIRVDYANEIDIYVERKNDVTTNYYNLIGLSGAIPDGVSVNVIDPFRMFKDEGAPEPEPPQTTPGVLLVGGKNVNYKYSEASDGTHAKVLLAGGYGSSTLTGGTMEFGNFIPAARIDQAKQHFGNVSGFDAAGQTLINTQIDTVIAPISPVGIIGSTMTASHGGLMFGGPGNNSFIATGPGNYEMIGGSWLNTFNISPSYSDVPATYQIDGGPYGQSQLIVRVPEDENITFENSTIVDKYDPSLKALAVTANAGLSVTAHGIQKVQVVGAPGANVTIGDTSELNIGFSVRGGVELTFGGTTAPDIFSVITTGPYHSLANHYAAPQISTYSTTQPGIPSTTRLLVWGGFAFPFPDPVYTVTRTFGNNGRTQSIPFAVSSAATSSINLNAGGASDTYSIDVGLGAFIDITINDTDTSSTNVLTVTTNDSSLIYRALNFTDTTVTFDYYTKCYVWSAYTEPNAYYPFTYVYYMSSVHYTPTVTFSSNIAPTVRTAIPFEQVTINRPLASRAAEFYIGGTYAPTPIPYFGLGIVIGAWDVSTNPWTFIQRGQVSVAPTVSILANGGSLLVTQDVASPIDYYSTITSFQVSGNTGTLSFIDSGNALWTGGLLLNIFANSGTINVREASSGVPYQPAFATATVIVGQEGSLTNIVGEINLTNPSGLLSLIINDALGGADTWLVDSTQTRIGNLVVNHLVNQGSYYDTVTSYLGYASSGSVFVFGNPPAFHSKSINGAWAAPNDLSVYAGLPSVRRGQSVDIQLSAYSGSGGTLTYGAKGLPPGLSINSAGRITGTVSAAAVQDSYTVKAYVIRNGTVGSISTFAWSILSAIQIILPEEMYRPGVEGTSPPTQPLTATNLLNRPVTFTATNLPPGITFNPQTAMFGGVFAPGSGQNGSYLITIEATDGIETAARQHYWSVTGITLTSPSNQFNRIGDVVDLPVTWSVASGVDVTVDVSGLPEGLVFDPQTRRIAGTIGAGSPVKNFVTISVANGNDYAVARFHWTTLPLGVSNYLSINALSDRYLHEGDSIFLYPLTYNSLRLPLTYHVTGLPPGLSLSLGGEGDWQIAGVVATGAASQLPYHVDLDVTDGHWFDSTSFDITVGLGSPVGFASNYTQYNAAFDTISTYITATHPNGEAITYSAIGLPPGLSINPTTGLVSGSLTDVTSVPVSYPVTITATTISGSDQTKFNWNFVGSNEGDNVAYLVHPAGLLTITSPTGTELHASISPTANVSLPAGVTFPFGFVTFEIRYLEPGQAADLTISGFNVSTLEDYYKFGPTPANPTSHWYNFLFGASTDSDNASGTGMEIVGITIVLHLVDGGRGDDDLSQNGIIFDVGGPAIENIVQSPALPGDYNLDKVVDAADYILWRKTLGQSVAAPYAGADGNGNQQVGSEDYGVWRSNFGGTAPMGGGTLVASAALTSGADAPLAIENPRSIGPADSGKVTAKDLRILEPVVLEGQAANKRHLVTAAMVDYLTASDSLLLRQPILASKRQQASARDTQNLKLTLFELSHNQSKHRFTDDPFNRLTEGTEEVDDTAWKYAFDDLAFHDLALAIRP